MASAKHRNRLSAQASATDLAGELAEMKRRYEELVGENLAGVFRTNLAGGFLECNASLAGMLGYSTADELMHIPVPELYPDPVERQRFIEELLSKRQLVNYEVLLRHKSGRQVNLLENVRLKQTEGQTLEIVGTAIDISAIRQAERQEHVLLNNYRQLAERARDGILLVRDGRIEYANQAASNLMGGHRPEGIAFLDILQEDDRPVVGPLIENMDREAGPVTVHLREGGSGPLMLFAVGTRYMGERAVQISLRDIEGEQRETRNQQRANIAEEINQVLRAEIAKHRRTQEALRQSKRFARSLIDSSLDMIIAVDKEGCITEFNPAAAIKFDYEADEIMGRGSRILYADQQEYEDLQDELLRHGAFAGEVRNVTRGGEEFISFLAASRLYDEDGQLQGSMGVSRDITRDKQDKEALRRSEERYRDLFENANDLIQSVDAEGRFIYVNNAWTRTLGYTQEELSTMRLMDIVDPERRGEMESWLRSGPGAGTPDHWRSTFISKSGAHLMMEGNSTVHIEDGRTLAVRSIFRDVTAAHEAQERLRKHAAKERAMFETSEHMFWTVDRRIALTGFNRGYSDMIHRLHGTRPEANHDPKRPKALFAPKEYHRFWEEKYAQVFSGKPVRFETDLLDQKGVRVCNEIFLSPILDDDGKVVEVFGIGHEVTSVKETQETAREQAARLKAIFESNANTMIWTLGKDMELTSLNGHFEEVMRSRLGVACEVGDSFVAGLLSRASGEMGSRVVRKLDEAFSGQPQQFEVRLERVDGHPLWMQCFVGPITVDDEVGEISCQAYDITDQKEAEHLLLENLREKEVLLKEVHHRVKNNLQIISSIFNLQKDHVDGDARSLALLHEGQNRIRSMSFIHESLYQSKNFSHVDLATYIGGLCRNLMMSYSLTGKVRLETDLQKVLLDLDRAIACGLILNELISNALKHAFPGSSDGTISIALREEEDKIGIEVSDDGKGLPDDLDEERPAGLGMELVNMLVEQLDGELRRGGVAGKRGTSYLLTFGRS